MPFDQFHDVIRVAFDDRGAAGIIAGRFVRRDAVSLDGPAPQEFLAAGAKPRLETLVAVASTRARPCR